jgi:hypothetical protein
MGPRATVVIPTHDHGAILRRTIPTVQQQSVADIEIFLVGDGATEETKRVVSELGRGDDRIRFFDHPKGGLRGEPARGEALREATGRIICYLSDDDLWMPDHVAVMEELLADSDFAHTYPCRVHPDGALVHWNVDLSRSWFRARMLAGENFFPFSSAGHTLELYRRLPHGWRTPPRGGWHDLSMWQQILSLGDVRAVSGWTPTVAYFPSTLRPNWSTERRCSELDSWLERLRGGGWGAVLERDLSRRVAQDAARLQADLADLQGRLEGATRWTAELLAQIQGAPHDQAGRIAPQI